MSVIGLLLGTWLFVIFAGLCWGFRLGGLPARPDFGSKNAEFLGPKSVGGVAGQHVVAGPGTFALTLVFMSVAKAVLACERTTTWARFGRGVWETGFVSFVGVGIAPNRTASCDRISGLDSYQ